MKTRLKSKKPTITSLCDALLKRRGDDATIQMLMADAGKRGIKLTARSASSHLCVRRRATS
jgi:hypothetical protein